MLYRPTKNHMLRGVIFSTIVASIFALLVYINGTESAKEPSRLIAMASIIFGISMGLSLGYYIARAAIKEMNRIFLRAVPNTPFTKKAADIPAPPKTFRRLISVGVGYVLFLVLFDFLMFCGLLIGWAYVKRGLTYSEIVEIVSLAVQLFSWSEQALMFWFFFLFIFVYFAGRYTWGYVSVDPVLKNKKNPTPIFVFNRIMIMWLTFGHGDDVRVSEMKKQPSPYRHVLGRMLLGAIIGLPFDLWKRTFWAIPLLAVLGALYEFALHAYRIDRSKGDKIKRVDTI